MSESVIYVIISMFAVFGFYMALYELKNLIVRIFISLSEKAHRD